MRKVKAKINEVENKYTIKKIQKAKICFFAKTNKTDKPLE